MIENDANAMTLGNMRTNHFVLGWMLILTLPTLAQTGVPSSPDEVIRRAREGFQKAQSKEQVESIKMFCKDALAALAFHESERLLTEATALLEANKTAEASSRIARLKALDEANDKLASAVCKP